MVHDFASVGRRFASLVPHRLFTVTWILPGGKEVERIHTSDAASYPLGERKPVGSDGWTELVLDRRQCFLANEPAGFALYFPDHDFIVSLGLGAVINVPIVDADRLLGTLNFLDRTGTYSPLLLAPCLELAPIAIPAFKAHEQAWQQAAAELNPAIEPPHR